ncbi:MAG: hypothetical protein CVV47_11480 [Spirochaetae bacterium HGW-Spirochaetae-3]|jgi:hypothetical protein|nr:MAG: hypothetical protein CVV47_11480 [Spirochaetae bacterium HGW-Spirochaetae-3]
MIAVGVAVGGANCGPGNGSTAGDGGRLISRLVITVSLSAYMIANLTGGYDRARLVSMPPGLPTPLSMLFIGIVISRVEWRRLRLDRDFALVLMGRFVQSPAILVLLIRWTDLPTLIKQVFLVQAMMPAITQTPILADAYGADTEYAGIATSFSTIMSLAVIPVCLAVSGIVL